LKEYAVYFRSVKYWGRARAYRVFPVPAKTRRGLDDLKSAMRGNVDEIDI
jgi:hypothetical protein